MTNKLNLNIADLNMMIDSGAVPMAPISNSNYTQFVKPAHRDQSYSKKEVDLIWHLTKKNFVVNDDMQEIATFPGNIWRLYRNAAEERFIIYKLEQETFPTWVLHFTRDFQDVHIYVNDTIINVTNEQKVYCDFLLQPLAYLFLVHYLLKNYSVIGKHSISAKR